MNILKKSYIALFLINAFILGAVAYLRAFNAFPQIDFSKINEFHFGAALVLLCLAPAVFFD